MTANLNLRISTEEVLDGGARQEEWLAGEIVIETLQWHFSKEALSTTFKVPHHLVELMYFILKTRNSVLKRGIVY